MRHYRLILLLAFLCLAACQKQTEKEPSLQKEIPLSAVKTPKEKFNRSKLKSYDDIYHYLETAFGKSIKTEKTETSKGVFLQAAYFKDQVSGNQYFVARNSIPSQSQKDFVYLGIIAYSPKALDIGLKMTDYYAYKDKILESNRYNPYVIGEAAISYREIAVTAKQKAYGISVFDKEEYDAFQENSLAITE